MLTTVYGSALHGVEAFLITIEVSVSRGIGYRITGLPDESIKESLSRITIALQECGFQMPRTKLLIHLGPADIRKSGSAFDLPIAVGILMATGQLANNGKLSRYVIAGELGLDGTIKPVQGAVCMSELVITRQLSGIILPQPNAHEAALIKGVAVFPVNHLKDIINFTNETITPYEYTSQTTLIEDIPADFKNFSGQPRLKRAMEIAAAGGHAILMHGFPGTGKSLAAKCLPSILPPINDQEMLETTKIYSTVSKAGNLSRLVARRPYREIHHTISEVGLIGGGPNAQPGEITLAHNGVLFMDEFTAFTSAALEGLRQPLTERKVVVCRAKSIIEYPASFMLVAAMNPCLCGYHHHPVKKCTCSSRALFSHRRKISGPILDRFDICVETEATGAEELFQSPIDNESSATIRQRVVSARQMQSTRLEQHKTIHCNAQLTHELIGQFCRLNEHEKKFLQRSWDSLQLSMRAFDKVQKVARTIADLAGRHDIELADLAEALSYRGKEHPHADKMHVKKVNNVNQLSQHTSDNHQTQYQDWQDR